jgi:Lon protease-like protein
MMGRYAPSDLPDLIPVFPLPGALLLPRARLPLHIFEPRYLQMLDDTLKSRHRLIGMVQPDERAAPGANSGLHQIGCAGRLSAFSETEDGRYMISLTGVSRFRIVRVNEGFAPYLRAEVGWEGFSRDLGGAETDPEFDRGGFFELLARYFATRGLETDWETMQRADDELLINSLSMIAPLDPGDKQALLEAPDLASRRRTLVGLIEFALHQGEATEDKLQ